MRRVALLLLPFFVICSATRASDWPKYCANLEMTGVAASGGNITPATARNLRLRWSVQLNGPIASAPTVAGGRVYVGDWSGVEWSLDASSGRDPITQYLGVTSAENCEPPVIGITSSAAIDGDTLFVAGGRDFFYALDKTTLGFRWAQKLGDSTLGYYGWCSPAVAENKVIQGVASNCDTPFVEGRVVGMNSGSGKLEADESLVPTWNSWTPLGGGVWTSPAVDVANGSVFVTTGSAWDINDGFAFSIVRLSLSGMQITDYWKINDKDWIDSDWGTSPTLFKTTEGVPLVGAGQKDGSYYAFRRDDLGRGPVWRTQIAVAGTCPQCGHGILSTAAFDGERLYVGGGHPIGDAQHGGAVSALDASDGHIIWQTAFNDPVIAPIAYTNGVLFTTTGTALVAIDAKSGEVLSIYRARAECVGGVAVTDTGIYFGDLSGTLYCLSANETPGRRRSVNVR